MFKNAIIYRIANVLSKDLDVAASLDRQAFVPCGATQPISYGWVPPRGVAGGALLEHIAGQDILRLQTETKTVPSQAIKRRLDELCKTIEDQTGRKPGKKQKKDLTEEVVLELLPQAFARRSTTTLWVDWSTRTLLVDAPSAARADDAVSALVKCIDGLSVSHIATMTSPAAAMSAWLASGEPPQNFTVDRECELKSMDEMKSVVRYGRHPLDIDEVRGHINAGKVPTRLALTWMGRVSLVLTDAMVLRKLTFLDGVFEGKKSTGEAFDSDVAIATGELKSLIADLLDALDGETTTNEESNDE